MLLGTPLPAAAPMLEGEGELPPSLLLTRGSEMLAPRRSGVGRGGLPPLPLGVGDCAGCIESTTKLEAAAGLKQ